MRARARTHTCDRGYAIASREIFRLPDFLSRSIVRPGKISKVVDLEMVARSVKKKFLSVGKWRHKDGILLDRIRTRLDHPGWKRRLGLSNSVEVAGRVGWPEGGGNYYKL